MNIDLHIIRVRDVVAGYFDHGENGVFGYRGLLNIRPIYQIEYVYKPKQRNAVIDSVQKGLPLNVMYWVYIGMGRYEVLDGQQRTISICQYINGDFSLNGRFFHNLTTSEQNQILDYHLMVYFCDGTDKEKLDWFKIVNIVNKILTEQELRNVAYTGPWLSAAKILFSRSNCVAYLLANDGGSLVSGIPLRQDFLETALSWISGGDIEGYMAAHQHDVNADELWAYFQAVIAWVRRTFTTYRKEMKGIEWGELYNIYKDVPYDAQAIDAEILRLIDDDDVTSLKGIYKFILTRDERWLSLRQFDDKTKRSMYEACRGICVRCGPGTHYELEGMEADHITPWSRGGTTTAENCQMLCKPCNRTKAGV